MRRAGAAKREVLPDPKYASRLVAKFVNIMMIRGKKSTAERIMYDALSVVEDKTKQEAIKAFKTAIDNVKPAAELLDAANNRGTAVKKREDTHKMAEANKVFAHYRW